MQKLNQCLFPHTRPLPQCMFQSSSDHLLEGDKTKKGEVIKNLLIESVFSSLGIEYWYLKEKTSKI